MGMTLESLAKMMNERFDEIDGRFEQIDRCFEEIDGRFKLLNSELS